MKTGVPKLLITAVLLVAASSLLANNTVQFDCFSYSTIEIGDFEPAGGDNVYGTEIDISWAWVSDNETACMHELRVIGPDGEILTNTDKPLDELPTNITFDASYLTEPTVLSFTFYYEYVTNPSDAEGEKITFSYAIAWLGEEEPEPKKTSTSDIERIILYIVVAIVAMLAGIVAYQIIKTVQRYQELKGIQMGFGIGGAAFNEEAVLDQEIALLQQQLVMQQLQGQPGRTTGAIPPDLSAQIAEIRASQEKIAKEQERLSKVIDGGPVKGAPTDEI